MNTKQITSAAKWAKGAVKETVGRLTRNARMQAEGRAERAAGNARNTAGSTKDTTRDGGSQKRP